MTTDKNLRPSNAQPSDEERARAVLGEHLWAVRPVVALLADVRADAHSEGYMLGCKDTRPASGSPSPRSSDKATAAAYEDPARLLDLAESDAFALADALERNGGTEPFDPELSMFHASIAAASLRYFARLRSSAARPAHTCSGDSPIGGDCLACDCGAGYGIGGHVAKCATRQTASPSSCKAEPAQCWGYSDDRDTERWIGAEGSREDVIAEGRETYPGQPFWICSGTECSAEQFMPDADDILETAAQRACDEIGDAAEDWPPSVPKEALAELTGFIRAWAAKHLPCRFWTADGDKERIEAPGQFTRKAGEP
jgi:hypothetical protein